MSEVREADGPLQKGKLPCFVSNERPKNVRYSTAEARICNRTARLETGTDSKIQTDRKSVV